MLITNADVLTWLKPRFDLIHPHRYLSDIGVPGLRLQAVARAIDWCSQSAKLCDACADSAGPVAAANWRRIRNELEAAYEFMLCMM